MSQIKDLPKLIEQILRGDVSNAADWKIDPLSDEVVRLTGPTGSLSVFNEDPDKLIARQRYELGQLIDIGRSLSATRDLDTLLGSILEKARFLAGADAGSIYVIDDQEDEGGEKRLRFKLSQNDSLDYEAQEFVVPVSLESIAGAAAVLKKTINIPDVREISKDSPYQYDATFDERTGYTTRSVLAVPMINLHNEVQGVVQLLNKKRNPELFLHSPEDFDREVIPMGEHTQALVETLASQAGVAMENAFLNQEIQHIFEGFVRASVHAIEQRDPTTSGHSFRVATLTRALAEAVTAQTTGTYGKTSFSEDDLNEI
jgi:GAF domain-containing protein